MKEKIVIRKKALFNRKKKYFEIDPQFFNPLIKLIRKQKKKNLNILSLYYPANHEINVLKFFTLIKAINIKNISTALPVTRPNFQMDFVKWKYLDPLEVNEFGMLDSSIRHY